MSTRNPEDVNGDGMVDIKDAFADPEAGKVTHPTDDSFEAKTVQSNTELNTLIEEMRTKRSPVKIEFDKCGQSFPNKEVEGGVLEVVKDISFTVEGDQTIAVLGPSGCGKSTVLKMVSGMHPRGLQMPTVGECRINGQVVTAPHDDVVTVFQTPVMAGWHTVLGNVMLSFRPFLFGPRRRWPWEWAQDVLATSLGRFERTRGLVPYSEPWREIRERSEAILEAVGLTDVMHQLPHQLSGGQKQRAALAASLVVNPRILCMDEPFSALDPSTRIECQNLLGTLKKKYPCVTFFITHDVPEAINVADRIIVLSTRPATVVADLQVTPEVKSPSVERETLETHIRHLLHEAARDGGHGTLTFTV